VSSGGEATSALDSGSEQLIRDALRRLSSVRSFDCIIALRVVQDGTPDALLRSDGLYDRLMEAERRRLVQARAA